MFGSGDLIVIVKNIIKIVLLIIPRDQIEEDIVFSAAVPGLAVPGSCDARAAMVVFQAAGTTILVFVARGFCSFTIWDFYSFTLCWVLGGERFLKEKEKK